MAIIKVLNILLVLILLFMGGCSKNSAFLPQVDMNKRVREIEGARLEYHNNVPFLHLSGNYYDMGFQYGVLLKDELHRIEDHVRRLKSSIYNWIPWYIRPFGGVILYFKLKSLERKLPKKYREELKGMVDGAEIPYKDALFTAFGAELLTFSCSSFIKRTENGIIHGRNLDYFLPFLGNFPVVVEYSPKGKFRYTLVGFTGFLGALSGMNEKGITISLNASPITKKNSELTIPICYKMREILEEASTIKDVDKLLENYETEQGWILTVGSLKEKNGVVYDIAGGRSVKNVMKEDRIWVTNYFLNRKIRHKYMGISFAGSPAFIARFDMLGKLLKKKVDGDEFTYALNILKNTDFYGYRNILGGCGITINNIITIQSVVMLPYQKSIYFSSSRGYSGWEKFIGYNTETYRVILSKNRESELKKERIAKLLSWNEKFYTLMIKRDLKGIIRLTEEVCAPTLYQFSFLLWAYSRNISMLKNDSKILNKLERLVEEYPDYSVPYLLKAKVLLDTERFEEAIEYANRALKVSLSFPNAQKAAYRILAKAYKKLKNKEKAGYYAKKCLELLRKYRIGRGEKRIEKEMKSILKL